MSSVLSTDLESCDTSCLHSNCVQKDIIVTNSKSLLSNGTKNRCALRVYIDQSEAQV